MNFLNIFEDHVANIFGATRAPFSFKKLAKQAAHEMEDQTLVINGVNTAPALYTILISSEDDPLMAPFYPELSHEVVDFVKAQAQKKRYIFVGEPLVRFMIDPALRGGKFSVFAENIDAPTLARLYEEERAYQKGLENQQTPQPAPRPQASQAQAPHATGVPSVPEVTPAASATPLALADISSEAVSDPFAPSAPDVAAAPIPVPRTMTREQIAGVGGAAATGAALGAAASIANNMAASHSPQVTTPPLAQLVDVVTGQTYEVTGQTCVVGRERSMSDIALRDPNVSRRHAQITYTGQDWTIEDLNSTNGTLVNNRRITRCPLRDGDLLTFGLSTFEFRG